jgi:hypothetical protein
VKNLRRNLSYSNVVASVSLFIALGGVSYAALTLPKGSVGTEQLKPQAVSTAKIKDGAITANKIRDGAVGGAKVDASTLGEVPSAVHASDADRADFANRATSSSLAEEAGNAMTLAGAPADSYGTALMSRTSIPATSSDAEWWIPVSGMGEPSPTLQGASMVYATTGPVIASEFTAFSWGGPNQEDKARVQVQLYYDSLPVSPSLPVTRLAWNSWGPDDKFKVGAGGWLAIRVVEKANGEEIPAMSLQTALFLSPEAVRKSGRP